MISLTHPSGGVLANPLLTAFTGIALRLANNRIHATRDIFFAIGGVVILFSILLFFSTITVIQG
jgi:acyl-coenzyme A synthetase/AMP-(fatty) acid ligase